MNFVGVDAANVLQYSNYEWDKIITPIKVEEFHKLLKETGYQQQKIQFLCDGFTRGFDLGYRGSMERNNLSENIPLKVGSKLELWNKVMEEVRLKHYTGPYKLENLPVKHFIQFPIGLVPKANGKTRLIFHLSYDFGVEEHDRSVNHHTPDHLCSVKYEDLDKAIQDCLQLMALNQNTNGTLFYGKSDFSSAFRILPILVIQRGILTMLAYHPVTGEKFYFMDLCLPFGSSRSCALFQEFSNAMKFIAQKKLSLTLMAPLAITNYLDDFLFIALCVRICNGMVKEFMVICSTIGCPIAPEKTEMATSRIVFLGVLLDGAQHILVIPEDKKTKAINLLNWAINKKKVTVEVCSTINRHAELSKSCDSAGSCIHKGNVLEFVFQNKQA